MGDCKELYTPRQVSETCISTSNSGRGSEVASVRLRPLLRCGECQKFVVPVDAVGATVFLEGAVLKSVEEFSYSSSFVGNPVLGLPRYYDSTGLNGNLLLNPPLFIN